MSLGKSTYVFNLNLILFLTVYRSENITLLDQNNYIENLNINSTKSSDILAVLA